MFVYNVTMKVGWDIADEWLDWQREEAIPAMMSTNLFDEYKMYRLLEQEDHEGPTFTIQFFTTDEDRYARYMKEFAPGLQEKTFAKWGTQAVAYGTCMMQVS